MTATIAQLHESEDITYSGDHSRVTSATRHYRVMGVASESEAVTFAAASVPSMLYSVPLRSIEVSERLSDEAWRLAANYELKSGSYIGGGSGGGSGGEDGTLPDEVVTFSNVMQSTRRYYSDYTSGRYLDCSKRETAIDYKGQIDVKDGEAQGVDVYFPVSTMNITHYFCKTQLTTEMRNRLIRQKPVVNQYDFRGFDSGELLFGGVNITLSGEGKSQCWRADFTFLISPNDAAVSIGGWNGETITKLGWEALWVDYERVTIDNVITNIPVQVNTEKVYSYMDFQIFGLSARG